MGPCDAQVGYPACIGRNLRTNYFLVRRDLRHPGWWGRVLRLDTRIRLADPMFVSSIDFIGKYIWLLGQQSMFGLLLLRHVWKVCYIHSSAKGGRFFRDSKGPTQTKSKFAFTLNDRLFSNYLSNIRAIITAIFYWLFSSVLTMIRSRLHRFHVLRWATLLIFDAGASRGPRKKRKKSDNPFACECTP